MPNKYTNKEIMPKIEKRFFEGILVNKNKDGNWSKNDFPEVISGELVTSTTYYLNDEHVATWSNGRGCIFTDFFN